MSNIYFFNERITMKTQCFLSLAMAGILSIPAAAQETYQDTKLMENELNGTARYVGMGGAMANHSLLSLVVSSPSRVTTPRRTGDWTLKVMPPMPASTRPDSFGLRAQGETHGSISASTSTRAATSTRFSPRPINSTMPLSTSSAQLNMPTA